MRQNTIFVVEKRYFFKICLGQEAEPLYGGKLLIMQNCTNNQCVQFKFEWRMILFHPKKIVYGRGMV